MRTSQVCHSAGPCADILRQWDFLIVIGVRVGLIQGQSALLADT